MKLTSKKLNKLIQEEFQRLMEGHSYVNKENINISPGRQLYQNGHILDVVERKKLEVEMKKDPSRSPQEYTGMKNTSPHIQPKIIRMDEPFTGNTVMSRKLFNDDFVNKRVKNKYPDLYDFFDNIEDGEKKTLDISVFLVFDSEHMGITIDLYITDGSVVKEPVDFGDLLILLREDNSFERVRDEVREKYSSEKQKYNKNPTILEFPNGNHGEGAEYIDNNTDIKVVWVSDFGDFLILLPVQDRYEINGELSRSGLDYEFENK